MTEQPRSKSQTLSCALDRPAKPPIFIVGCPRSGTGLLRNLLRAHPNLSFTPESHFVPLFYKAYGDPQNERQALSLARKILNLHWIRHWQLPVQVENFRDCRRYEDVVATLYEAWARGENKPRWGDKTPQYVAEIPSLRRLFPQAKILHILRDGRDVALSWVRAPFGPSNIYNAATAWRRFVTQGRTAGGNLPDDGYHEVRYEQLLEDAESVMRSVCDFIGEPFAPEVLTPSPLQDRVYPLILDWSRQRPLRMIPEIVSSNQSKWKHEMTPADRILFESVAGDLLQSLGYQTEGKTRRVSKLERAAWKVHNVVSSGLRRLNRKQKQEWIPAFLVMARAKARTHLRARDFVR